MNRISSFVSAVVFAVLLMAVAPIPNEVSANENRPKLTIGSKAPKIDIEHWMSMPEGFSEVKRFEKGRVYVVEFWATWCGPCLRAMPHIAEIAEDYADKGVQVIGVSDEDLSKVEAFLKKKPKNAEEQTWAQITSKYCLTCDPDGSVKKGIFRAAGQSGIPRAFIIGKTGHVEWIGHPVRIDEPLEQIVSDTWDRKAFKESFEREYRVKRNRRELGKLLKAEKYSMAVALISKLADDSEGADRKKWQLKGLEICLDNELRRADGEFKKIASEHYKDAVMMNRMAWTVVSAHQAGVKVDSDVLDLAKTAINQAVKLERSAAALDTLAHIAEMEGNIEEAIEAQSEAVEKADGELKQELEEYLEQLKQKK